jgi:hypothetical protein
VVSSSSGIYCDESNIMHMQVSWNKTDHEGKSLDSMYRISVRLYHGH